MPERTGSNGSPSPDQPDGSSLHLTEFIMTLLFMAFFKAINKNEKCKIYKRDKNALKKANIKFGDIMWSIREIKSGNYFFNEKGNENYRKYK